MNGALRPNYRRARALASEINALAVVLEEAGGDPKTTSEQMEDLREEMAHLRHEFFLTGVSSEYEL